MIASIWSPGSSIPTTANDLKGLFYPWMRRIGTCCNTYASTTITRLLYTSRMYGFRLPPLPYDDGSSQVRHELYLMSSSRDPVQLDDSFEGRITISHLWRGFFATFTGYTTPPFIKKWQLGDSKSTWSVWRRTEYASIDLSELTVSQVSLSTRSPIIYHR